MRLMKKALITVGIVLSAALISPSAARGITDAVTVTANAKVKINKKKAFLGTGRTLRLKVTGTKKKVKWSTSNKSIATVTPQGVVNGKKEGIAKIKAKVGKKTYSCKVTVAYIYKDDEPHFEAQISAVSDEKSANIFVAIANVGNAALHFGDDETGYGVYYPKGISTDENAYIGAAMQSSYWNGNITSYDIKSGTIDALFLRLDKASTVGKESALALPFTYKGTKYYAVITKDGVYNQKVEEME